MCGCPGQPHRPEVGTHEIKGVLREFESCASGQVRPRHDRDGRPSRNQLVERGASEENLVVVARGEFGAVIAIARQPRPVRWVELIDLGKADLIDRPLTGERTAREGWWSEAVAVGNLNFVEKVKSELGFKAVYRKVIEAVGTPT